MERFRKRVLAALVCLSMVAVPATADAATADSFVDNFDTFDSGRWHKADGWTNGNMFNAGWRADHVRFSGGVAALDLNTASCPGGCSGRPYASGEYRTNSFASYGRFEARLRAVRRSGVVTGFFTYTGPSDGQPWDEIDVEILGKNTRQVQTNYFTDGVGGHETIIDLGFDASTGFHDYAIEWRKGTVTWFVDGRRVHQENGTRGPLPTHPQRLMLNLWPGIGIDGWTGPFNYPGSTLTARFDRVGYTRY